MKKKGILGRQRITQWVTGGQYAVAVEVEAILPVDDPSEPCLSRKTVLELERLAERAEAGDVTSLQAAGRVYTRLPAPKMAR